MLIMSRRSSGALRTALSAAMAALALSWFGLAILSHSRTHAARAELVAESAKPAVATRPLMAIVPAPVIDSSAGLFVGTGDGGQGSWTKP